MVTLKIGYLAVVALAVCNCDTLFVGASSVAGGTSRSSSVASTSRGSVASESTDTVDSNDNSSSSSSFGGVYPNNNDHPAFVDEAQQEVLDKKVDDFLKKVVFEPIYWWDSSSQRKNELGSRTVIKYLEPLCSTADSDYINMTASTAEEKQERRYSAMAICGPLFCESFKESLRRQEEEFCNDDCAFESGQFEVEQENTHCLIDVHPLKTGRATNDICVCAFRDIAHVRLVTYVIHEQVHDLEERGIFHYMRLADRTYNIVPRLTDFSYSPYHVRVRLTRGKNKEYFSVWKLYDLKHPQQHSNCFWGKFKIYAHQNTPLPSPYIERVE